MSEKIVVKYYANSEYATTPFQATEGLAGHDLFASQCKILFSGSVTAISTELRCAIPKGFFGKVFQRSGLLREHFIS